MLNLAFAFQIVSAEQPLAVRDEGTIDRYRAFLPGEKVGEDRFQLQERLGYMGLSTTSNELPWNQIGLLPGGENQFKGIVQSVPYQLEAWSEYLSSAFYISKCAGRGANGEVWRGVHFSENGIIKVVLKRIFKHRGTGAQASALREIYFGKLLGEYSEHFSRFVLHFTEADDLWLVFRDEGISLYHAIFQPAIIGEFSVMTRSQFWREIRKNPQISVQIMRQVLEGLDSLHSKNITHRDIKLENILMDPSNFHIRLGDFGSACLSDVESLRQMFPPNGPSLNEETRRYAPPEALQDTESHETLLRKPSFDIWCVGVMWLELLMGTVDLGLDVHTRDGICIREPECDLETLRARIHKRDPFSTTAIDDAILRVIVKLVHWNPEKRPSASELLKDPIFRTSNCLESGPADLNVRLSTYTSQGSRSSMEDRLFAESLEMRGEREWFLGCVFDGHNGDQVAEYLVKRLPQIVQSMSVNYFSPFDTLKASVDAATSEIESELGNLGLTGSTLCCLLVNEKGEAAVANIGDSRLIHVVPTSEWEPKVGGRVKYGANLTSSGRITQVSGERVLVIPDHQPNRVTVAKNFEPDTDSPVSVQQRTIDHKPTDPKEKEFIENLGGQVIDSRVNGILAVSRSIGAPDLEPFVRPLPDFFKFNLQSGSKIVIATDGVWDVLENQEVGEISNLGAARIGQEALTRGARDNLAVVVAVFNTKQSTCRKIVD
jgi:serine/threonine protein kinase